MANATSTLQEVKKTLASFSLKTIVKDARRTQGVSMRVLDKKVGLKQGGVARNLDSSNMRVHLLIALSTQLRMNLFEPYITILPNDIQETERERKLKTQLATLQTEFDTLKKERDLLKEIVMK